MAQILMSDEIQAITGKQQPAAQCRALLAMKIPFVQRLDGTPCVAKEAANQCLGVQSSPYNHEPVVMDLDSI